MTTRWRLLVCAVVGLCGASVTAQDARPPLRLEIPPALLRAPSQPPATSTPPNNPPRVDLVVPTVFYVASVSSAWAGASATCIADDVCDTVTPVLPTVGAVKKALGWGLLIQGGALWVVHQWVAPTWPRVAQGVLYAMSALHIGKAADHVLTSRRVSRSVSGDEP